jgi:protein O-mannosyl-transferase
MAMVKMTENEDEARTASEQPSLPVVDASRWHTALAAVGVGALALAAYAPIWSGGYQFLNVDDNEYVTENPQVQAGLTSPSLWWALTAFHSHNWHPLTWMSLQLDWQLYGDNPLGFHITNVLLHAANTVLLFFALRSLTGALWRSAVVAAFFAVHPLHVESVAWVAERKDVLSTLFWILTMWAYSAYAAQPGWGRYRLTLVLFALGLMAKPMLVTLPCVLLLLDYWPLRRWDIGQGAAGCWGLVKEKLPFFALVGGCSLLTLRAQQDIMQSLDYLPLPYRLANVPLAYLRYIGMMFWPIHLTVYYPHPGPNISFGQSAAAAGLLLALTALVLWQARRRPYLAVGWLWYLGTLVPVIGLVQVGRQANADRYTYIPSIGLFLILAWGAYDFLGRRSTARRAAVPVLAGLLAACLLLTWRQLPIWRDSATLWQHALSIRPSGIAHQGLAMAWEKEGRLDDARRQYAEAIRFDPTAVAYYYVGCFLATHGWLDDALEHFAQSLALLPDQARAHNNMGLILLEQGKLDEAQEHVTEAIRLDPNFVPAQTNMGRVLLKKGKLDESWQYLSEVLRLAPHSADGHYYLGLVLERQGKFREAEAELIEALKKKPGSANARFHLGAIFEGQGRTRDAEQCFVSALRSDPNHVEAHTSLGALLAREGRLEAGQEHLRAALSRDPRNGRAHFNLGLILELDGQLADARRQFADALAADPNDIEARRHLETATSQPPRQPFRVLPTGVPSR